MKITSSVHDYSVRVISRALSLGKTQVSIVFDLFVFGKFVEEEIQSSSSSKKKMKKKLWSSKDFYDSVELNASDEE